MIETPSTTFASAANPRIYFNQITRKLYKYTKSQEGEGKSRKGEGEKNGG